MQKHKRMAVDEMPDDKKTYDINSCASACRRRTTGGVRPGVKDRASSPALDWRLCLLDSVPRLYMAGVRAKSAKNTPPLSGFSRKACAICKRETSGQMPNLPYISQISRFSSDELGVCPCISMIGVYREFRVGSMTIRGVKASLWARVRGLRCAGLLTQRISQS